MQQTTLKQLDSILQRMGDAFVSLDHDWRYTFVNDKALALMGKTSGDLLGRSLWDVFPDVAGSIFETEYRKVMDEGLSTSFEVYYPSYDMWMEVRSYPYDDGISIFYTDITERKKAQRSIEEINKDLENKVQERTMELTAMLEREKGLNDLKSRFVSIASHEFRTPLSTILSSVELIGNYSAQGEVEKQKKHIDRIKNSVENLISTLGVFLSLEKLEQGKVNLEVEEFDLKEFIENIQEDFENILKPNQEIKYTHTGSPTIFSDKRILRNVLLNLISNAGKYSTDHIYINTSIQGNTVKISIEDKGIGIPDEEQKHLFSKFFRAGNVGGIQGTGLGLNIVKRYIELLKGNIIFESKDGEGTIFRIEFDNEALRHSTNH